MENKLTPRLQYLIEHYGKHLQETLAKRDKLKLAEDEVVLKFSEFDPSVNKSATQWLIKTYLAKGFRFEDLSKAKTNLELFGFNRAKLPVEKRDLNHYKTLASLWKTIAPLLHSEDAVLSSREQKKANKEKAYRETFILKEDEDVKIVVPLTEFSACWWGRVTQWCTASDNDNMFSHYNQQAPLVIFSFKKACNKLSNRKFQLFVSGNDFQFMDEQDEELSREFITENFEYFKEIMLYSAEVEFEHLQYMPLHTITPEMCWRAVATHGLNIEHCPKEFQTRDLIVKSVETSCSAILICRNQNLIDDEIYMYHLEQHKTSNLGVVPRRLLTEDVIMKMLMENSSCIVNMPEDILNQRLCNFAVADNASLVFSVPKKHRTLDLCRTAIQNMTTVFNFKYIPEEFRPYLAIEFFLKIRYEEDYRLQIEAIDQHLKTDEFFQEISKNVFLTNVIPRKYATKKSYMKAVQLDGSYLIKVPNYMIDLEMCIEAVKSSYRAIMYVPENLHTEELYRTAIEANYLALLDADPEILTIDLIKLAIEQNPEALYLAPQKFQGEELNQFAFSLYSKETFDVKTDEVHHEVWGLNDFHPASGSEEIVSLTLEQCWKRAEALRDKIFPDISLTISP